MSDVPRDPQEVPPLPYETGDKEARNWAMLCHLSALLGYFLIPLGNIIFPLIVWLMKKDQFPFVDEQGKEALNFQLSFTIWFLISCLSFLLCIGIVLVPAVYVVGIVLVIVASVKAAGGEHFRYPLTIRFFN